MATLGSPSPPASPSFHGRRKSWARKLERCCCVTFTHLPLLFVYGLTTWAIWVELHVSFLGSPGLPAYLKAGAGILLYCLLNLSYTIAVFTGPGSPSDTRRDADAVRAHKSGYAGLPTSEHEAGGGMTMVTAKSTGRPRYCKKCNCVKPDRTHHCSTCGKCVLKMDHHCPWLATCVGLRNYKPFLLFLIYTTLFCELDFSVSASWVWAAIENDEHVQEGLGLVNIILMTVLGGIIGLVLGGFTAWHVYLVFTGQTTIECLEKTRYLAPVRKSMERQLQTDSHASTGYGSSDRSLMDQLKETHANAIPGVLRPEEGEDRSNTVSPLPSSHSHGYQPPSPGPAASSPAHHSLQRSYASLEAQREHQRYDAYLDEQASEKLPNAFTLGWKRNLQHVFGVEPWLWGLPVCNTNGDGWLWEISPIWLDAHTEMDRERAARARENAVWQEEARDDRPRPGPRVYAPEARRPNHRWAPGQGFVDENVASTISPMKRSDGHDSETNLQMLPLDRRKPSEGYDIDEYDTSSDEDRRTGMLPARSQHRTMENWNDVPHEFLTARRTRSPSRGRTKGD